MEDDRFQAGETLWLRGERVTFVDYLDYAPHRIDAAVVRRYDERQLRVVLLGKLTRDREASLGRANPALVG
jgi:hypothetical protein